MARDYGDRDVYLNQKAWCKRCDIDYEEVKEQIRKLNALIISLGKKTLPKYSKDNIVWKAIVKALNESHQDRDYWLKITDLTNSIKTQETCLLWLFSYLLLVEGRFVKYVRLFTVLLVQSDHDLFDPLTNEFVTSFEQIDKIGLSIQLKFLRKHGFAFFIDSCDKKLRNDIAHLNLIVMPDGRIVNRKTGKEIYDLFDKILRLDWMLTLVGCALDYMLWKQDPEQNYMGIKQYYLEQKSKGLL